MILLHSLTDLETSVGFILSPFFQWDRQPFWTDVADSSAPSLTPLYNEIHHNYLIANYESSMCVDNDDGRWVQSARYCNY